MELNFNTLEEYLQDYLDNELSEDLGKVTPAQRVGFIEKYLEFIEPKELRRGTKTAGDDKDFKLVLVE